MMPNLIFIVGPSCSGKSSMTDAICQIDKDYLALDDVTPLYMIFHADNLLHQRQMLDFWEFVNKNDLCSYYESKNPLPYSHPNNSGGYQIDNPIVWNMVLSILGKRVKKKSIVEFSRGSDNKYNQMFNISNQDVYSKSFEALCKDISIDLLDKSIILNINASLSIRKKRNFLRFQKGGHFVSENTMETVYQTDVFGARKYMEVKGIKIPVFSIKNEVTLEYYDVFFEQEYNKALDFYRRLKGNG